MVFSLPVFVLLEVTLLHSLLLCHAAHPSLEKDLINSLLTDYNKNALPTIDPRGIVNVTFGIRLRNILKVDERTQVIKTRIWVAQTWRNELMTWKPAQWSNITKINIQPDLVWLPDTVLYNAAGDTFPGGTETYKTQVVAHSDGMHSWNSPASFSTSCNINVRFFPFDEQLCFLRFGSWAHDKGKIDMYPEPVEWVTIYLIDSSEWTVTSPVVKRNIQIYACCNHPFVDVQFFFTLKRKPMYFILTLIIPCLLMLPLTTVSFYLPPESGERIGLTITILLAVAVFLQVTSQSLPKSSENIPLIGLFFLTIMATTTLSLITTGFVLLIHFKGEGDHTNRVPNWARKIFLGKLARVLRVTKPAKDKSYSIDDFSPFACESGMMLLKEHYSTAYEENNRGPESSPCANHQEVPQSSAFKPKSEEKRCSGNCLEDMLKHLSYFSKHLRDSENKIRLAQEWKDLAKVLDCLILIIFVTACITISFGLLYPVFQN